ncbi:TPA: SH3 domain-containing protein [Campylobacter jejuni]|nr:SH3 domain-containing protein [Campylobacter jejuni]HED9021656.1 SH3 domain-containing protein [Campylobacter jejuni]
MKILLTLIFSVVVLFGRGEISVFSGQDENMQKELQKLPQEEQKIYQNITPSDENNDFESNVDDPFVAKGSLVLTNDEYPSRVYVGEVFPITIYARTTENTKFDFNISVEKTNLSFLNPDAKWEFINNEYKTTLWFEAKNSNASLSKISIKLLRNNEAFQEADINLNPIKFENTLSNKDFSHLVASSLEIKKVKASYFDDANIIMMVELNATNTNLKSFFIEGIQKQGIENLKGDFNASSAFYYAILPLSKTNFEFSYFNKDSKKLENINLKLKISDDEISTQSDLNPVNKDLNIYKQYTLWFLAVLFGALFVWRKNYIILALAVVCFTLSFLVDTNTQNAIIKAGSRAKILPTEPSTYFYTANADEKVEVLGKRQNYIKVLFSDGKIGWVNKDDLQKN